MVLFGLLLALDVAPVTAQEAGKTVVKRGVISEDLYVAGGRVDILAEVAGDVIAAGGRVTIGQVVTGDVIVIGGDVAVTGQVLDDVRAAGGIVTINGKISGDVIAAGGSVSVTPETTVGGKAWLAGVDVEVRGTIHRWLRAAAKTIRISGQIEGDVKLVAQEIEVLPTARIEGNFTYTSPREAKIDPAAQIRGAVTHRRAEFPEDVARTAAAMVWIGRILLFPGLMAAGIVLFLLFPGFTVSAARTIKSNPWKSLAAGFALLVSTPVAGVLLCITILGIPLGLAVFALYFVSLLVGFLTAAFFLGDLGTRLFRRGPELSKGWRVLSLVVALIVLGLARLIPVVGIMILFLALLFGLGASSVHGYRAYAGTRP